MAPDHAEKEKHKANRNLLRIEFSGHSQQPLIRLW